MSGILHGNEKAKMRVLPETFRWRRIGKNNDIADDIARIG